MDVKEVMEHVRRELREQNSSYFSLICFRVGKKKVSLTEVHDAFYELLKRDEIVISNGKCRLLEQRRLAPLSEELDHRDRARVSANNS